MKIFPHTLIFLTISIAATIKFHVEAATPTGALIKHFSSLLKWTTTSPNIPEAEANVIQFENGYLVETIVEGNKLGFVPYAIRVSPDGELLAVNSINSNIVRITPPLSQYSRARLVAGSFQGYVGLVDGKPSDARFNHPKGVTMDNKGNVYVADTLNMAIRKIGETGVTTIAGGRSNVAGYRDGPSDDAKFSNDFDVVYVGSTCSLLVIDRGNAALRQISLQQEDCDHQSSSISASDVILVLGAVLIGYASCWLQHGSGPSFPTETKQISETELKDHASREKPSLLIETLTEDPDAGWPSFGRLVLDLFKFSMEALLNGFLSLVPLHWAFGKSNKGLTQPKEGLVMPEKNKAGPAQVQKLRSSAPSLSETRSSNVYMQTLKTQKNKQLTPTTKDPSASIKHRSSKRQEFAEFYGSSSEAAHQLSSKTQKERTRHRHRDKSGEVVFGAVGMEQPKPTEIKSVDYSDPKFDHFNIRSKFGAEDQFRF
ncbi:hypothetical protein QJS10_CPA03g00729 [Acorus calamus]|uniref:NHL repeat-containing protein n=1 Tax=Acorus calamus TaxID=4465 RepID=A0AAV9F5T7_ACOCL|nr:hypothetical protein QJS10_CPA03g00729 [Acorus calamus]